MARGSSFLLLLRVSRKETGKKTSPPPLLYSAISPERVGRKNAANKKEGPQVMDIKDYQPPNWFSAVGISKKRKQIEAKGIPDMTNARFLTLTLNQMLFLNELDGYLQGKARMRRFTLKARDLFKDRYDDIWSCWKLEFHTEEDSYGWPHWHMGLAVTHKLSHEEMALLSEYWGLGRVNVRRIKGRTLDYFFKYCFKAPMAGEAPVPDWFQDHIESTDKGIKTFSRVRFWQASPNFYTGIKEKPVEKKEPQTCLFPRTVREQIELWARMVQLTATGPDGTYLKSSVTVLAVEKKHFFTALSCLIIGGAAVHVDGKGIRTHQDNIKQHLDKWQNQNQLMQTDRLRKLARSPLPILTRSSQSKSLPKSFRKVREYELRAS